MHTLEHPCWFLLQENRCNLPDRITITQYIDVCIKSIWITVQTTEGRGGEWVRMWK